MSAPRDAIRTRREARRVRLQAANNLHLAPRALIAAASVRDYRCVASRALVEGDAAKVDAGVLKALKLDAGAEALIWVENAH